MLRVQASIISQTGDLYKVEVRAENCEVPYIFNILAKSDTAAAMQAIRRVEEMDDVTSQSTGIN